MYTHTLLLLLPLQTITLFREGFTFLHANSHIILWYCFLSSLAAICICNIHYIWHAYILYIYILFKCSHIQRWLASYNAARHEHERKQLLPQHLWHHRQVVTAAAGISPQPGPLNLFIYWPQFIREPNLHCPTNIIWSGGHLQCYTAVTLLSLRAKILRVRMLPGRERPEIWAVTIISPTRDSIP